MLGCALKINNQLLAAKSRNMETTTYDDDPSRPSVKVSSYAAIKLELAKKTRCTSAFIGSGAGRALS
jgi:hypothetical protein